MLLSLLLLGRTTLAIPTARVFRNRSMHSDAQDNQSDAADFRKGRNLAEH